MATYTARSNTYDGRYLELTITQTKNESSNSSTLRWTLTSTGGSALYYTVYPTTIKINGTEVYSKEKTSYTTGNFPAAKGSTSGTLTVYHDSDGSLTVPVVFQTGVYSSAYQDDYGGYFYLDSIATKATLTGVGDIMDYDSMLEADGSYELIVNYSNPSGAYIELILSTTGDEDVVITLNRNARYQIINLTPAQLTALRKGVTSGDSAPLIYHLRSYVDGSTKFHEVTKSYLLKDHTPLLSPVAYDSNDTTYALTGNRDVFIRGYSKAYVGTGAQARKGATISRYYIRNNPTLLTTDYGTIENVRSSEFVFTVDDSRGNRATQTLEKTLIEYIPVTANLSTNTKIVGERGAVSTLTISGNYFNDTFGAVNNSLSVSYCIKNEAGEFGDWIELTPEVSGDYYTASQEFEELDYQSSRTVKVKVTDKLVNIVTKELEIQVIPVFDWSNEDFNFNVPVRIHNIEQDYIVESGESGIWHYEKWNSGKAVCWGTEEFVTTVNNAWGSAHTGNPDTGTINYPFTFVERPVENVTMQTELYASWLYSKAANSAKVTGKYNIAKFGGAVTDSATFYMNYYVIGRWK